MRRWLARLRERRGWTRHHQQAHGCDWWEAWQWAGWNVMHPVTAGGAGNLCLDRKCDCGRLKGAM